MTATGQQRLYEGFYQNEDGKWTLRTGVGGLGGAFDVPSNAKAVVKDRTGLVDTFSFYSDTAATLLIKTITITYVSGAREEYTVTVTTP